jgi:hypothetical protein
MQMQMRRGEGRGVKNRWRDEEGDERQCEERWCEG